MAELKKHELSLFAPEILKPAVWESFKKLAPHLVIKNPVMFVVEIGSVLTTLILFRDLFAPTPQSQPVWFTANVAVWLWFTVVFANLAEAVAEGRGKAQAATLRRSKKDTIARRLTESGAEEQVPGIDLKIGDLVVVEAGEGTPRAAGAVAGLAPGD